MKNKVKTVLKAALVVILAVIMLIAATTVLGLLLQDERQLSPWGTAFFVVVSGSMEPTIPLGSVIFVRTVPEDSIAVGDILAFFSSGRREAEIITHRVVDIIEREHDRIFITRGDANNTNDPPLAYRHIVGRVFYTLPGNNFLLNMFGRASTIGIVVISIGLALTILAVIGNRKKKGKEESQEDPSEGEAELQESPSEGEAETLNSADEHSTGSDE